MSPRLRPVEQPVPVPVALRPFTGRLLRISDVADRLAGSQSMAWKLVTNGEIKSIRIGKAVRIRPYDVDDYVDRVSG